MSSALCQSGFYSVALSLWEEQAVFALVIMCWIYENWILPCPLGCGGVSSLLCVCGNDLRLIFGRCRNGRPSSLLSHSDFKAYAKFPGLYHFKATSLQAISASVFMVVLTL